MIEFTRMKPCMQVKKKQDSDKGASTYRPLFSITIDLHLKNLIITTENKQILAQYGKLPVNGCAAQLVSKVAACVDMDKDNYDYLCRAALLIENGEAILSEVPASGPCSYAMLTKLRTLFFNRVKVLGFPESVLSTYFEQLLFTSRKITS